MKSLLAIIALSLLFSTAARAEDNYYSQAELNQMLAPVALYPDTVLSHLLIASTYPLEVVQADRWAQRNPQLEGQDAVDAVSNQNWDPSVQALVAFPHILERMAEDLDWTQSLGDAFLQSETVVLATVQDLRQRAYESGNLKTTTHQEVVREERTIIIEPRSHEVVYIPYYDTRVVYGPWYWSSYQPVVWHRPSRGYWYGDVFWSHGSRVSTGFYFSSFHWSNNHIVVVDARSHSRPRFTSGRSVVRYSNAQRWHHNPTHRRGVHYRHDTVRQRYATPSRQARPMNHSPANNHRAAEQRATNSRSTRIRQNQDAGSVERNLRATNPQRTSESRRRSSAEETTPNRSRSVTRTPDRTQERTQSRTQERQAGSSQREPAPQRRLNRQSNERTDSSSDEDNRTYTAPTRQEQRPGRAGRMQSRGNERSEQNVQRGTRERVDNARSRDRSTNSRAGSRTTTRDR